jgi:peptide/nickel transport system permease protein
MHGLRKGLLWFFTLWGVVTLVFLLFFGLSSDAVESALGQNSDEKTRQAIRTKWGLDQPLSVQYLQTLNRLSPVGFHPTDSTSLEFSGVWVWKGDEKGCMLKWPYLGKSFQNNRSVSDLLMESLPGTAILALSAIGIALILGLALGGITAWKQGTWLDRALVGISTLGISIPSYLAAVLAAFFLGYWWHDATGLPISGSWMDYDVWEGKHIAWKNLILPAFTLGIRPLAVVLQMSRSSFLETYSMDYIRTARAKGLSEWAVFRWHVLRNSMAPVVTTITGWLASLLAGAVFVETIFGWKGLGKLTVDALNASDLPVLMGIVLLVSILFMFLQALTDRIHRWIDPRIREE